MIYYRSLQEQINDILTFGMSILSMGFVCVMVKTLMSAVLEPEKESPKLLPQLTPKQIKEAEWEELYARRHPNVIEGIIQDGVISTRKAMEGAKCVEAKLRSKLGDKCIEKVIVIGSFAHGYQRKNDARGGVAGLASDIDDAERWDRITPGRAESWRQALINLTTSVTGKMPYDMVTADEPVNISLKQLEGILAGIL